MSEILFNTVNHIHPDPDKDRIGSFKAGMPVIVKPDLFSWGPDEAWPDFALIKVPTIPVEKVAAVALPHKITGVDGHPITYRKRRWIIQWSSLPQAVKDTFVANGEITVKAGSYTGAYDYTWAQVKNYFLNQETTFYGFEIA